jgi:AcrR family transcriptional regulator
LNQADHARTRLLQAAVEVFGRDGLEGATVRTIASKAGENVAAISYHFGSKEKLYRAVMEQVAHQIRERLGDIIQQIQELESQREPSPREALCLLQEFLSAVYLRLLSRSEIVAMGRLIVREQMQPTAGFEILYRQSFEGLHRRLCFLVGTVLGADPKSPETIVRTHTLMGQVYFFAMSRETILRRLQWKSLEGGNAQLVAALIAENIEVLLRGLARRRKVESQS